MTQQIRECRKVLEMMIRQYEKRGHGIHQKNALTTALKILQEVEGYKLRIEELESKLDYPTKEINELQSQLLAMRGKVSVGKIEKIIADYWNNHYIFNPMIGKYQLKEFVSKDLAQSLVEYFNNDIGGGEK